MAEIFANSEDPDQMVHSAASDLGLHCVPVTVLGVSWQQWVNFWKQKSKFVRVMPLSNFGILYGQAYSWGNSVLQTHF